MGGGKELIMESLKAALQMSLACHELIYSVDVKIGVLDNSNA